MIAQTSPEDKRLLVVLAGTSDLQFVADTAAGLRRVWCDSRALHEAMLGKPAAFACADKPGLPAATGRDCRVEAEALATAIAAASPERPLAWVPGKLLGVVEALCATPPHSVLVLNTFRNPPSHPREPVALGPFLAQWLAQRFGLSTAAQLRFTPEHPFDASSARAGYLDFLVDDEDFERPADEERAIGRIGAVLRQARRAGATSALIVDTGGLSRFKDSVALLAGLWFDGRVHSLRQAAVRSPAPAAAIAADEPLQLLDAATLAHRLAAPDAAPASATGAPRLVPALRENAVVESLRLRLQVAAQIRSCNIAAAQALCEHPAAPDARGSRWRRALDTAQEVLVGERLVAPDADLPWLLPDRRPLQRPVIAALRTECALHAGRIAEAMLHTCECYEWVLFDAIRARLAWLIESNAELTEVVTVNSERWLILPTGFRPRPVLQAAGFVALRDRPWQFAFGNQEGVALVELYENEQLARVLAHEAANRQWREILGLDALTAMEAALSSEGAPWHTSARFLRNWQAHAGLAGTPDREQRLGLPAAVSVFVKAGLWRDLDWCDARARAGLEPGTAFLHRKLVLALLQATPGADGRYAGLDKNFADWLDRLAEAVAVGE